MKMIVLRLLFSLKVKKKRETTLGEKRTKSKYTKVLANQDFCYFHYTDIANFCTNQRIGG